MRIFVVAIICFFLSVAPTHAENYQSPKYLDMSETYGFLLEYEKQHKMAIEVI